MPIFSAAISTQAQPNIATLEGLANITVTGQITTGTSVSGTAGTATVNGFAGGKSGSASGAVVASVVNVG